jgi:hypothetical protein
LLDLVRKAGFEGFSDARRSFALTPKQARGKFAAKEASALIDLLLSTDKQPKDGELPEGVDVSDVVRNAAQSKREALAELKRAEQQTILVRGFPADLLAEELVRRGWVVTEPQTQT